MFWHTDDNWDNHVPGKGSQRSRRNRSGDRNTESKTAFCLHGIFYKIIQETPRSENWSTPVQDTCVGDGPNPSLACPPEDVDLTRTSFLWPFAEELHFVTSAPGTCSGADWLLWVTKKTLGTNRESDPEVTPGSHQPGWSSKETRFAAGSQKQRGWKEGYRTHHHRANTGVTGATGRPDLSVKNQVGDIKLRIQIALFCK